MRAMGLTAGTQIGPYEIAALLGAGGMGEVYRAVDKRLGRQVAIKLLVSSGNDGDRLRRFEVETRAVSALQHANILALYDVGDFRERPFLVSELLHGETLRERLNRSAMDPAKGVDLAIQLCRGLAAAHDKGIVHRDIKPENLFITREGVLKILDFGIAKREVHENDDKDVKQTSGVMERTETGTVLGTAGYMSPEQVRGHAADRRSDMFAVGAVLYEMLAAQRAFQRDSALESAYAILRDDPPELPPGVSPALARLVRRCLEKGPDDRFQSARDLAFALDAVSIPVAPSRSVKRRRWPILAAGVAVLILGIAAATPFVKRAVLRSAPPSYTRVTFRRGLVESARFAPDGRSVIFSALWGDDPLQTFTTLPGDSGSRPLGAPGFKILSVSRAGELAVSLHPKRVPGGWARECGVLARVPFAGGEPRPILDQVFAADWAPNGTDLAVSRLVDGRTRLELPIGHTLYETTGGVSSPRVSLDGKLVAFVDHPAQLDGLGSLEIVDLHGSKRTLSKDWASIGGVAWAKGGEELWFTASKANLPESLHAVSLSGKERLLARVPEGLNLEDISVNGNVLMTTYWTATDVRGLFGENNHERDVGWFDTVVVDLSADGSVVLRGDGGDTCGGSDCCAFIRKMDGSPAVRIGDGCPLALSPDGKWVLVNRPGSPGHLELLPTGVGERQIVPASTIQQFVSACFLPDGKRLVVSGFAGNDAARLFVVDIATGQPQPVSTEGIGFHDATHVVSPDGRAVFAMGPDARYSVYSLDGSAGPRPIQWIQEKEKPIQWSEDNKELFVIRAEAQLTLIDRIEIATGKRQRWREIPYGDDVFHDPWVIMTPDGKSYAYRTFQANATLYLAEGLF
jgi:tRNA A-37 threonylcarbamoyl transferase component Bud32